MSVITEIKECEVCGSDVLEDVLSLGSQPMCDDLKVIGSGQVATAYPIDILYCVRCHTAHQKYQIKKEILFPATYHYRSRLTGDVVEGMRQLVSSVKSISGSLSGKTVLDVGCNDGSLLDCFAIEGCVTLGVEPTDAYRDAVGKGHQIFHGYFDYDLATQLRETVGGVDVITFTNVFAHIEDLKSLLEALALVMSSNTLLVIENHYLGSVLERQQFDTFYHEHPRTYSATSFRYVADSLSSRLLGVEFPQRYGGNIRAFIGSQSNFGDGLNFREQTTRVARERHFYKEFSALRDFITRWKTEKRLQINELKSAHGGLSAKAFPGRASILVNLLSLTAEDIEAVYEQPDSPKIGHCVPGTDIPIKSDAELFGLSTSATPKCVINLAWHISDEIHLYMRSQGYDGQIVDIL